MGHPWDPDLKEKQQRWASDLNRPFALSTYRIGIGPLVNELPPVATLEIVNVTSCVALGTFLVSTSKRALESPAGIRKSAALVPSFRRIFSCGTELSIFSRVPEGGAGFSSTMVRAPFVRAFFGNGRTHHYTSGFVCWVHMHLGSRSEIISSCASCC
jgi:hypothetical protein